MVAHRIKERRSDGFLVPVLIGNSIGRAVFVPLLDNALVTVET